MKRIMCVLFALPLVAFGQTAQPQTMDEQPRHQARQKTTADASAGADVKTENRGRDREVRTHEQGGVNMQGREHRDRLDMQGRERTDVNVQNRERNDVNVQNRERNRVDVNVENRERPQMTRETTTTHREVRAEHRDGRFFFRDRELHRHPGFDRSDWHFRIGVHDRTWYLSRYEVVFVDGCWYYIDGPYLYPAYGFDPDCQYPDQFIVFQIG